MTSTVYVPGPKSDFVELSRSPKGRLFRKQILRFDTFAHPNDAAAKLTIDSDMADKLIRNFKDGVCDIVQIPKVGADNKHTEAVDANIGEVIDLTKEKDGVYALMDVRSEEDANKLGKTLLGVSAMMHLDYKDTRTGKHVGPTLLHTAITNRPYITNLNDFEEIIAASADTDGEGPVLLTEVSEAEETSKETDMPTKEELIAALKDEHGIDVAELEARASEDRTDELVSAMSAVLKEAGVVKFAAGDDDESAELGVRDVAEAVIELSQEKLELARTVETLVADRDRARDEAAAREVDDLVKQGKVLPAQKDVMVRLAREDRETFEALIPDQAIVSLSEDGVTVHDAPGNEQFEAEVQRLAAIAQPTKEGK